jgi:uncharacterized protein
MNKLKTLSTLAFLTIFVFSFRSSEMISTKEIFIVADQLEPLPAGSSIIYGFLGEKLDQCIVNGVMAKDYELYIAPFRNRDDDPGRWQGEFWGKWFTSATMAYNYRQNPEYRKIIDAAVSGLIKTQDKGGRLSSYTNDFGDWDIWGRKYALLGLVSYYDETGNQKALDAAAKALDDLISVTGPGKRKITETGLTLLESLSSSSVLEPVVLIYQRTGNPKYLEYAEYIVSLWSEPSNYNPRGMRLVEDAIAGVDPVNISAPKAYEQMSCYEGMAELYRVTGNQDYLTALITYAHNLREKEIMIIGSGSSGELWLDGANRQTELIEKPLETCVTTTWIKFCYQLLRITGDPVWADEMEITLYNAMLAAMMNEGHWWAYFTPLAGERTPSHMQVPTCQSSCCVANGPRGLLTAPAWSVMRSENGPVVNLYAEGKWNYDLENGNNLVINQSTDYPRSGDIEITIKQDNPARYTMSLRIPAWSEKAIVRVNGDVMNARPGSYFNLTREWKSGDKITLSLDMRGRVITAPSNRNQMAVMRGPIVLALDSRLTEQKDENVWLLHEGYEWKRDPQWNIDYALLKPVSSFPDQMYLDLIPVEPAPEGFWMAFEVPFLIRPSHFVDHKKTTLVMTDYASAGNLFSDESLFRVWLPQPLYLNYAFPGAGKNAFIFLDRE